MTGQPQIVIPGRRAEAPRAKADEPGIQTRIPTVMYVYLLASQKQGTLYLGVTRNLVRRVSQYKQKALPGFTSRYDVRRLVWFECYDAPADAITREKEIKKWRRGWKIELIEKENPDWQDLHPEIVL